MRNENCYDVLSVGRACLDLYADEVGVPFPEVEHFAAYVGGCPANIAVSARRLGLRVAMLSAVGEDLVGDFVLRFLEKEGIETRYIARKAAQRTGAAALSIQPPDRFPLVYYRDNAADVYMDINDVLRAPIAESRVLLVSGTGLSCEPSRSATMLALELARAAGGHTMMDLDLRTDQWADPRAYGIAVRAVLPLLDTVIGTEDEIRAVVLRDAAQMTVTHGQVSSAEIAGDLEEAITRVLSAGPAVLVVKRGAEGATVREKTRPAVDVPGFPVNILNTLGAGDAFAGGLIYGYRQGWNWPRAARFGNAVGAMVVTRHACANDMPFLDEVLAFME